MSIKEERFEPYFNFDCNAVNVSSDNSDLLRQQPFITRISAHQLAKQQMYDKLQKYIHALNSFISPDNPYKHNPEKPWTHQKLLRLIDDKMQQLFISNADQSDEVRLNSL